jgi:molybdopterin synthase sulfur carrier subunit
MPTIRIPTPLRTYTEGKSEVAVQGENVSGALSDLTRQYPALRQHIFNESSELRPFVNLFLNEDNVKDLQGLETPLDENTRLMIIPSIAGG